MHSTTSLGRSKGYSDTNYKENKVERESTSGEYHFMGSILISWISKKQGTIALSTIEAEYISVVECCSSCFGLEINLLIMELIRLTFQIW